jgi:hypothetical protein
MPDDEQLLNEFFAAATATIEELVTQALRQGHPGAQIAILLERRFDGEVAGGCGPRAGIAKKLSGDTRLPASARDAVVSAIIDAPRTEIPVVLLVHAEGVIVGGIRSVQGGLIAVS